ncbi:MAG: hypothetical protein NVS4B11_03500 [Ktedonobacteraceae bacterium]
MYATNVEKSSQKILKKHVSLPSHKILETFLRYIQRLSTGHPILRHVCNGTLAATKEVNIPEGRLRKAIYHIKHVLSGASISNTMAEQEQLTKFEAEYCVHHLMKK